MRKEDMRIMGTLGGLVLFVLGVLVIAFQPSTNAGGTVKDIATIATGLGLVICCYSIFSLHKITEKHTRR